MSLRLTDEILKEARVKELNDERRRLWMDVWLVLARSEGCATREVPALWADQCLRDYDTRFNNK